MTGVQTCALPILSGKGLIIKNASGTTGANLQEWQTSGGVVKTYIRTTGGADNELFGQVSSDVISGLYFCPTNSTTAAFSIPNSSTINMSAAIVAGSASSVGLIVKGASSQTANLQQWQDSTGANVASLDPYGSFTTNGNIYSFVKIYANSYGAIGNSAVTLSANNASTATYIIKGYASQTGSLQEWQNSNASVMAYITPSGALTTSDRITTYNGITATNASGFGTWVPFTNNAIVGITTMYSNSPGLIIRGTASQTANLQEWQNSSGTLVAWIDSLGKINSYNREIGRAHV